MPSWALTNPMKVTATEGYRRGKEETDAVILSQDMVFPSHSPDAQLGGQPCLLLRNKEPWVVKQVQTCSCIVHAVMMYYKMHYCYHHLQWGETTQRHARTAIQNGRQISSGHPWLHNCCEGEGPCILFSRRCPIEPQFYPVLLSQVKDVRHVNHMRILNDHFAGEVALQATSLICGMHGENATANQLPIQNSPFS